jgi:hypothetical protein
MSLDSDDDFKDALEVAADEMSSFRIYAMPLTNSGEQRDVAVVSGTK